MDAFNKENAERLKLLCQRHKVKRLFLFGSANTPAFTDKSDIDFLISFKEKELPLLDYADNFFHLQEELEKLFKRKIDLVVEKSVSNPYLKSSIERTKALIYG